MRLGVNIDHVATLRNARDEKYPSPVHAALMAEDAGASNVTCHLRDCLLYTSPSPRDRQKSRMPSSA